MIMRVATALIICGLLGAAAALWLATAEGPLPRPPLSATQSLESQAIGRGVVLEPQPGRVALPDVSYTDACLRVQVFVGAGLAGRGLPIAIEGRLEREGDWQGLFKASTDQASLATFTLAPLRAWCNRPGIGRVLLRAAVADASCRSCGIEFPIPVSNDTIVQLHLPSLEALHVELLDSTGQRFKRSAQVVLRWNSQDGASAHRSLETVDGLAVFGAVEVGLPLNVSACALPSGWPATRQALQLAGGVEQKVQLRFPPAIDYSVQLVKTDSEPCVRQLIRTFAVFADGKRGPPAYQRTDQEGRFRFASPTALLRMVDVEVLSEPDRFPDLLGSFPILSGSEKLVEVVVRLEAAQRETVWEGEIVGVGDSPVLAPSFGLSRVVAGSVEGVPIVTQREHNEWRVVTAPSATKGNLRVSAEGFQAAVVDLDAGSPPRIVLQPAVTLRGSVILDSSMVPADFHVAIKNDGVLRDMPLDPNGRFAAGGLADIVTEVLVLTQHTNLCVASWNGRISSDPAEIDARGRVKMMNVVLHDGEANPIQSTVVALRCGDVSARTSTDEAGRLKLLLPIDVLELTVKIPSRQPVTWRGENLLVIRRP